MFNLKSMKMKSFNVNALGVEEMTLQESMSTEGGGFGLVLLLVIIGLCASCFDAR